MFGRFWKLDKCRQEAAGDVRSGLALGYVGRDVLTLVIIVFELFDSLSGRSRLAHFVQYLITICSRSEAASDVISGKIYRS